MQTPHTNAIRLAFVSADPTKPDPATVGEVARQTITDLRTQGYTVQPAYTGAKGGDVFTIVTQLGQNIIDNKELLTALIIMATPILNFLLNRDEKRLDNDDTAGTPPPQQPSVNLFFITIEQATTPVDAADLDDHERLLRKLLDTQPNLLDTITPESTLEIERRVPPKPPRRLR